MFVNWNKKIPTYKKNGLIYLLVGFICFTAAFVFKQDQLSYQDQPSSQQSPEPVKDVIREDDYPNGILIPKVGVDLEVLPAKVINDDWQIATDSASYLLESGIPGKKGNVVIYGHNQNFLFGPILWLVEDDIIKIIDKKGKEFSYQVIETKTVTPEMVGILSPTQDPTLTLYTCTGWLDKERFVVKAKLQL